ncbi:MAG TPA: peptidoglycan-binding protein [Bradyrhizobium sp.]
MPRRIVDDEDEEKPRRRRRHADAVVVETDAEHGLLLRALLYSPKDLVAGALAFAAITAIVTNALFLQPGPHPSPMFGTIVTIPAPAVPVSPLPRPRPPEATRSEAAPGETKALETRAVERTAEPRMVEKTVEARSSDPLTNLVRTTSTAPVATSSIPRPPAAIPVSSRSESALSPGGSRRVAAVQRALTDYGYGQLKPTGTIGPDTQAAIVRFERARRLPATGQMNERLVRELSAMIGHPID